MIGDVAFAVTNASAGYDGRPVLHDVSVSIAEGECVAIMGRSGAGKSTLLGLLYDQAPSRVALVPQAAALVKTLSVFHNVYMGRLDRHSTSYNLRNLVWPRGDELEHVSSILADVGIALEHADRIIVLEGGRKIIDEPASALKASDLIGHFGGTPP